MSLTGVDQPKYVELSDELKARIRSGEFQPGQQIPTEPELMDRYQVSRNTVRQAVARLEEANYLIRRRGAGTFVREIDAAGRPRRSLESILFLLVDDVIQGEAYNVAQTAAAQRWAAEHGVALVISTLVTEDLLRGHRPAVLDRGFYQAILFDGWVTDMHCQIARELKLPYLIVGNHPVSSGLPQVRIDIDDAVARMFGHIDQAHPGKPVALMLEPMKLHVSRELLVAYMAEVDRRDTQIPLLELVADYQVAQGLERLFTRAAGPFALIINNRHLEATVDFYRRRQVDPGAYPIFCITGREEVAEKDRPFVSCVSLGPRTIIGESLVHLVEAYRSGEVEKIHVVLQAPEVLVP